MAAAGFDVAAGDTWAVNELSSAVRIGTGASRQNIRDLVHGLYDGDGGPPAKGVVFVTGIAQPTASLDTYKARLESWLQDAEFWGDMSAYVSDFLQEDYGDVRDYAVAGADVPTRLGFLNAYLQHVLALGARRAAGGGRRGAGHSRTRATRRSRTPRGRGPRPSASRPSPPTRCRTSSPPRSTPCAPTTLRSAGAATASASRGTRRTRSASRRADFNAQSAAIVRPGSPRRSRLGRPGRAGRRRVPLPWCTAALDGAAFTPAWSTFSTWTPTRPGLRLPAADGRAGTATGPMSVQLADRRHRRRRSRSTRPPRSRRARRRIVLDLAHGALVADARRDVPAGSTQRDVLHARLAGRHTDGDRVVGDRSRRPSRDRDRTGRAARAGERRQHDCLRRSAAPRSPSTRHSRVSDAASPTLVSASVAIATGSTPGDVLTATTVGTSDHRGLRERHADAERHGDSLANYQAVLQSVAFSGTDDDRRNAHRPLDGRRRRHLGLGRQHHRLHGRRRRPRQAPRQAPATARPWSPSPRPPRTAARRSPPTRSPRRPAGPRRQARQPDRRLPGSRTARAYSFTVTATNARRDRARLGRLEHASRRVRPSPPEPEAAEAAEAAAREAPGPRSFP